MYVFQPKTIHKLLLHQDKWLMSLTEILINISDTFWHLYVK